MVEKLKKQLANGEINSNSIAEMLPDEQKALKAILEEVVTEKLGVNVSKSEITTISEKAKNIDEAQKKLGDNLGVPSKLKENLEFFKAKKKMEDYLQGLVPANRLKVTTGTIGRGMMLFSIKSPTLNIGSNIEIGFSEALSRRLAGFKFIGTDNKLARDYIRMVNKIYQQTGYDVSRMTSIADTGSGGERVLGKTVHSQGKGAVRKVGRFIEDVVFKQLMGAPDVAFSSAHFADSVNLNSLRMANGDKVKAKEWMEDAMRIEPQTAEGIILREQGVLDAQKATWTDDSWASKVSEGIRKLLNTTTGDLRAGDYLLPFVKTPANVIATGMDYAGLGIPKSIFKIVKAVKTGELGSKKVTQSIARDLIRSGLGITAGVILAGLFDDDDFVGAYDPARAQIESLRNSNYNAIRIGDKWISMDWFGPLSTTISAIMYARKYGKTGGEKTFQYTKGVLSSALNIPGVSDVYDTVKTNMYKKNQSLEEMTGEAQNYISSEIYSRLIPSFFSDVSKVIDPTVRETQKGFSGIKSKIPGLSYSLPSKVNIFGEEIKQEPGWSVILFGARVKTNKETELVKEIKSVADNLNKSVTFTDWDKSSSKQLSQFKEKIGEEKYKDAKIKYGSELKSLLTKELSKTKYKKMTDEDKLKVINNIDTEAMDKIFKQYRFKYKQQK